MRIKMLLALFIFVISCSQQINDPTIYGEWAQVKIEYMTNIDEQIIEDFIWENEIPKETQRIVFNEDGTVLSGMYEDDMYKTTYSLEFDNLVFTNSGYNKNGYTVRRLDDTYLIIEQDKEFGASTIFLKKVEE